MVSGPVDVVIIGFPGNKFTGKIAPAIKELVEGIKRNDRTQVLLGVTGSGKTFTMAHVIQRLQRPALVMVHNKTLAAQLFQEFRRFFPRNAVEYFVSYYDYYQPEAYMPASGTYIEKEATINDELDRLRLSATRSLFERRDCVIVASVSCIYGLGSPEAYYGMLLMLEKGQKITREQILRRLVEGVPRHLRPGGSFYTFVTAADCEGQPFEDRLRLWLGEAQAEFDVVLAAHGWFNRMLRPQLKKRGWANVHDGGDKYWSFRIYQKR